MIGQDDGEEERKIGSSPDEHDRGKREGRPGREIGEGKRKSGDQGNGENRGSSWNRGRGTRRRGRGRFVEGKGKLDGWEEGEEDSGEFGNGSGWPEREEVRGGSDGEKTGEIVEGMIGGDGGAAFWKAAR